MRRTLAVVLVLASFAGATVLSSLHRQALLTAAKKDATASADARWNETADGFHTSAKALGELAHHVTELENFKRIVEAETSQTDMRHFAKTFHDAQHDEAWLRDVLGTTEAVFGLGDRIDAADSSALAAEVMKRRTRATLEPSSDVVLVDGAPWLVSVARSKVTNMNGESAFVGLGRPLDATDLKVPDSAAAQLLVGGAVVSAVGASRGLERHDRRRISMKRDDGPCCAQKPLADGVELAVFEDPEPRLTAAEADANTGLAPRFGIAGVVALVGALALLLTGGKAGPDARDALLIETQAQLRQSQEVLQKLSTGAFATQVAAGPTQPSAPIDEGLANTRASMTASRYEVVAPLGEGGMARVSIAVARGAEGFKRTFVLKRLRPELVGNQELVNQFIDEARLGASLVHSNIVPVFDFGRDADGYYLTQEYILGRDVGALIEASLRLRQRPLEPAVVAAIGQEALKALSYAHTRTNDAGQAAGLVHRDVSPANLMVSLRGEVKLLDFGIVKSAERVTQTQAGVVKGNLFFMSPEQARALPVDPRSDLFSLAMVLTNAVLGRTLYTGATMYELMTRAAAGPTSDDLELVRQGAGPLAPFLTKGLALAPDDRFPNATAMAAALAQTLPAAPSVALEALMREFFRDELEAERARLTGAA